jgi:hypothetical protein
VTAVVDARGDLVNQRAGAGGKELDGQHTDVIEGLGDVERHGSGLVDMGKDCGARGNRGAAEDALAVDVFR